jgi:hypothetical protein
MSNTTGMADLSMRVRDFDGISSWQQVLGAVPDAHAYAYGSHSTAGSTTATAATFAATIETADAAKAARVRNANVAKPAPPPRGAPR